MQRYLQYRALVSSGLAHFDAWASTFGDTVTSLELAPEGTGYRARTRFAKFFNLPELMLMIKEFADIKTADMLDLPVPKANYHTVSVKPSDIQAELVAELSERATKVQKKEVQPNEDNMLKITTDGRKIGLDQRLINPLLPDFEDSKVNACANNVFNIWEKTNANRLTQMVFCDFSTPTRKGRFNVYDDIKAKLLEKGVPENEIAFIHDASTETQKKELFAKVRKGQVRILFGSTFKMGSGTNVQDLLISSHDLDCPWRPSDLEQRSGRIIRQGNTNPEVDIYRYVTEATFDAYLWQTIEKKQQFISQIMTSKSPVRACQDIDETVLSYAEIKALCIGDERIREKMDLDIDVSRLRLLKSDYQSQHYRLEDKLAKEFPQSIERTKEYIAGYEKDINRLAANTMAVAEGFSPMIINGVTYTEKGDAGAALLESFKHFKSSDGNKIGSYRGFAMYLSFNGFEGQFKLTLKGSMSYTLSLGNDTFGNITRINNAFSEIPSRLKSAQIQLDNLHQQVENAKQEITKPFQFEQELAEKEKRLAFLDAGLNMGNESSDLPPQDAEEFENEAGYEDIDDKEAFDDEYYDGYNDVSAKGKRPSILDRLKARIENSPLDGINRTKSAETSL